MHIYVSGGYFYHKQAVLRKVVDLGLRAPYREHPKGHCLAEDGDGQGCNWACGEGQRQVPDACRLPGEQSSNLKKLPQFTMCLNLPSTATYRAATYLVPQFTVQEISVPQFANCRNLPPAATYRLPEFSVPQLSGHHNFYLVLNDRNVEGWVIGVHLWHQGFWLPFCQKFFFLLLWCKRVLYNVTLVHQVQRSTTNNKLRNVRKITGLSITIATYDWHSCFFIQRLPSSVSPP